MANLERIYFKSAVKAEDTTRFVLIFEKQVVSSDSTVLRCELHDPIFNINHCLGDIKVTTLDAPTEKECDTLTLHDALKYARILQIKFPEKLAGGTFQITILVSKDSANIAAWESGYDVAHKNEQERIVQQKKNWQQRWDEELIEKSKSLLTHQVCCKLVDPSSIVTYLPEDILTRPVEQGYFSENITVNSSVTGTPKLQDIYIAHDDNIEFGRDSITQPLLKKTSVLQAHEIPILHVHSRGMYGKEVFCLSKIRGESKRETKTFRILDNTLVCRLPDFTYNANDATTYTFDIFVAKDELALNNATNALQTSIKLKKNTVQPVPPSTSAVYTSTGKEPDPPEHSDTQCKVEFRPAISYDGSFGFSWYRFGDTKEFGDVKSLKNDDLDYSWNSTLPFNDQSFDDIMGYHTERIGDTKAVFQDINDTSSYANFQKNEQMAKKHRYDYHRIEMPHIYPHDPNDAADPKAPDKEYYIPYMTLRKGVEAELQLLITVKSSSPDKLIFDFDNPKALEDGFLQINGASVPYEIASPPVADMDAQKSIKIKCLKEFSKPLRLRVIAEVSNPTDTNKKKFWLCGAVTILPNDISHQRNIKVLLVNVITMLEDASNETTENEKTITPKAKIESEKPALQKYLGQAYINPQIEVVDLKFINFDGDIESEYARLRETVEDTNIMALNYAKDAEIMEYLLNKLASEYPAYSHYFKIFFTTDNLCTLDDNTNQYKIVNGGFAVGEKFVLCVLPDEEDDCFVSHELLHSLGLPHTFEGTACESKYVYECGMTDNLMDYCHFNYYMVGNNKIHPVKSQSLFHWQWKAINTKI